MVPIMMDFGPLLSGKSEPLQADGTARLARAPRPSPRVGLHRNAVGHQPAWARAPCPSPQTCSPTRRGCDDGARGRRMNSGSLGEMELSATHRGSGVIEAFKSSETAAKRSTPSRHMLRPTSLGAHQCAPSSVCACACLAKPCATSSSDSAFPIKSALIQKSVPPPARAGVLKLVSGGAHRSVSSAIWKLSVHNF
jgi:hypothetical protein